MIATLLGGIGLFLLGMILLSEGLKSFAGDSLRQALLRFTGKPVSAFLSGAVVTALVQSSSATTLTTIGFVSAGLLSFSQAVGVVMGASLGTTSTGWLVSVFGLKFSIAKLALPLVGAGAFMRLLWKGRAASLGEALAGFGLIFVGIDFLQQGMAGVSESIDLSALPSTGLTGHLLMMLIGILLTVVMQSSSAAVATTLTALYSGAINFDQAASLVIGSAVGTTVTAALTCIGGSTGAKRTALAHILFNLFTGLVAVILLPVFLMFLRWAQEHIGLEPGAVSLAAFHSLFIALGVLIFLPIVGPFSRWIENLLPDRGPHLTRNLDPSLLTLPPVAMETVRNALRDTAYLLFQGLRSRIDGITPSAKDSQTVAEIETALICISEFMTQIPSLEHQSPGVTLRRDSFHGIDHLSQLLPNLSQQQDALADEVFKDALQQCRISLEMACDIVMHCNQSEEMMHMKLIEKLEQQSKKIADWRKVERKSLLEKSARNEISPTQSLSMLDTVRWIDQIAYHCWRIAVYLRPRH